MSVEGLPSEVGAWNMLAAECVMEAGSREIVRSRQLRMIPGQPVQVAAPGVPELLAVAGRQWS